MKGARGKLRLALRLLAREARAGELRVLVAALVIAVGAVTAVALLTDRVSRGVGQQSAELLGADLVVTAEAPHPAQWRAAARERGLAIGELVEFASVVVMGERLQLASVRAVDATYPLRGAVKTAPAPYAPDAITRGVPAPGSVWVDTRMLQELRAAIGDRVEIGNASFTIERVLTYEPGRGGNFFGAAPSVLMHAQDLAATGVLQPGSRATYAFAVAGGELAVAAFRAWVAPQAASSRRIMDTRSGNPSIARAIERVDRFIGLTSLLAVLLAGVAVAMGARRYSARHYDVSAMLRCLGATQRDILLLYGTQLLVIGVTASAVGCIVGWVGQEILQLLLRDLLPVRLPTPGMAPLALGFATGLLTLAGFALAPILRLRAVSPLRVLRRELTPLPASAWLVASAALGAMLLLMWRYTDSPRLILGVLGGALAAGIVLAGVGFGLLAAGRRLIARAGATWRFGLSNLWRRPRASLAQVLAFGFTFMAMALMVLVRGDLLASWQRQLPADAPNHFAFNILPADVARVEQFFADHRIEAQALYPMVRGRLTTINGTAVTQAVTKEEESNEALHRELNLTWAAQLPPDNRIVAGAWWDAAKAAGVSVEERLAKRLGIQAGDRLGFTIGGASISVPVASLRKVQWDSFHPNFYMIFTPGALDGMPATYLTSFHLTADQKPLLAQLVRAFPATSVLETDQVITQVRTILAHVTAAVEFVLLFVLAAGFAVLYAALVASLDERRQESALLRALGARRGQLIGAQLAEFVVLGLLAGVLAAAGAEIIAWALYSRVFDIEYAFKWRVWLATPTISAALLAVAGHLGARRIAQQSPLGVLRDAQ